MSEVDMCNFRLLLHHAMGKIFERFFVLILRTIFLLQGLKIGLEKNQDLLKDVKFQILCV